MLFVLIVKRIRYPLPKGKIIVRFGLITYEAQTLLLNGVSVSDRRIRHKYSYDTCRTPFGEVFNSKNICWICDNFGTGLTQI